MKRAVVVLLLLIANAIVSSSRMAPTTSAPVERQYHSLGLFTVLDGAPLRSETGGHSTCPAKGPSEKARVPFADDLRL